LKNNGENDRNTDGFRRAILARPTFETRMPPKGCVDLIRGLPTAMWNAIMNKTSVHQVNPFSKLINVSQVVDTQRLATGAQGFSDIRDYHIHAAYRSSVNCSTGNSIGEDTAAFQAMFSTIVRTPGERGGGLITCTATRSLSMLQYLIRLTLLCAFLSLVSLLILTEGLPADWRLSRQKLTR
jgi:hypothetical protein